MLVYQRVSNGKMMANQLDFTCRSKKTHRVQSQRVCSTILILEKCMDPSQTYHFMACFKINKLVAGFQAPSSINYR
jgi:hypothetical protein